MEVSSGTQHTGAVGDAKMPALLGSTPGVLTARQVSEQLRGHAVATPHLLRGTVHGHLHDGVAKGAVDAAQRTANGTALQAALDYARANGKFFELEPGRYEFSKAGGLKVEGDGFVWRGSMATELFQFSDNEPVVQIGREPATNNGYHGMDVAGLSAYHGNPQPAANTGAVAILMRSSWASNFRALNGGGVPGWRNYPYWTMLLSGTGGDCWWFQNTLEDCHLNHGVAGCFKHALMSTQCVFSNIHCGGGNPTPYAFSEAMVSFDENYARGQGNVVECLNIEWGKGPKFLNLNVCKNFAFTGLHFEGCELATAWGGSFVYGIASSASFREVDFENCAILAANIPGGTPALFNGYGDTRFTVEGLRFYPAKPDGTDASRLTMDWAVWEPPGADGDPDGTSRFTARDAEIASTAPLRAFGAVGPDLPKAAFRRPDAFSAYEWDRCRGGRIRGAVSYMADADHTHYGNSADATLVWPASLAAARTLVLSDRLGPVGWQANAKVPAGAMAKVRRQAGTYANPLTVKNLAAGGATLATGAAAGADLLFRFDGTNWAAAA